MKRILGKIIIAVFMVVCISCNAYGEGLDVKVLRGYDKQKIQKLIDDFSFKMSHPETITEGGWTYFIKDGREVTRIMGEGILCRIDNERSRLELLNQMNITDIISLKGDWLYVLEESGENSKLLKINTITGEKISLWSEDFYPWDLKDGYLYFIGEVDNKDNFYRMKLGEDKPYVILEDVWSGNEKESKLALRSEEAVREYLPFSREPKVRRYQYEEQDKRAKDRLGITPQKQESEAHSMGVDMERLVKNYMGEDSLYYYYHDGAGIAVVKDNIINNIIQKEGCKIYRESKGSGKLELVAKNVFFTTPRYSYYSSIEEINEDMKHMEDKTYLGEIFAVDRFQGENTIKELVDDNRVVGSEYRFIINLPGCRMDQADFNNLIMEVLHNRRVSQESLLYTTHIEYPIDESGEESTFIVVQFTWNR